MADQTSRGGQKDGGLNPDNPQTARGTATQGAGERSDHDKRQDQMGNPDDAAREPTDKDRPPGEQKPTVHRTGENN
jgi:hypothetical protein